MHDHAQSIIRRHIEDARQAAKLDADDPVRAEGHHIYAVLLELIADEIADALDSRAGEDVRPDSWAATPDEVRERAQLLADVELHLKSSRIFVTTREKMHPCGVELHDELLGRVTAAIDSIGKAKGHD